MSDQLRIIYYHTISNVELEYFPFKATQSVDTFSKQINYLHKRYNIISLKEAIHLAENHEKFDNHLVITTDDGLKENYTTIAPVLSDLGLTFTALVCNNLIDNKALMWRNALFYVNRKIGRTRIEPVMQLACDHFGMEKPLPNETVMTWSLRTWPYKLKDDLACFIWNQLFDQSITEYLNSTKPYLTSEQVSELLNNGFSIGSHSKSHPYFKILTDDEIRLESIEAANLLEKQFKTNITAFSFPFERPQESSFALHAEKILSEKFKVILGTKDRGSNQNDPQTKWERVSMEFDYRFSVINFHLSPIRERLATSR